MTATNTYFREFFRDRRGLAEMLGLAALYLLTARLGLLLAIPGGHVTLVWPPSGIALAAVMLREGRIWPGIWLGSFAANFWDFYFSPAGLGPALGSAAVIGAGASLAAWVGAGLVRHFTNGRNPLERARDVCAFLALGGMASSLISATIGVLTLYSGGRIPGADYGSTWLTWWLGDTAGVFVVTPLWLVWSDPGRLKPLARRMEFFACLGLLLAIAYFVFVSRSSIPQRAFLPIPFLVWAAVRFGQRGATTATGLLALPAVWGTIHQAGPFGPNELTSSLMLLELFLGVAVGTALCMAAIVTERDNAAAAQELALAELESRVIARTTELTQSEAQARELLLIAEKSRSTLLSIFEDEQAVKAELAKNREFLSEAQRIAHLGSWHLDQLTNRVVWSEELYKMFGADPALPAPTFNESSKLFTPESWAKLSTALPLTQATGKPYELELETVRADGGHGWMWVRGEVVSDASGQIIGLQGVALDITARKQAELALRESEFRWKFAIEGSGDGLWDWNVPASKVFFSRRWKEMLGYADDEIGDGLEEWSRRVHPDDLIPVMGDVQAHLDGTTPSYINEHRVQCKDGGWKWILDRGLVVSRDAAGKPLRMIGTHTDITARKEVEAAVSRSEARLNHALEATLDGIWDWNIRTGEVYFSPQWARLLGYAPDEVPSRVEFFATLLHPEDAQLVSKVQAEHLAGRTPVKQCEVRLRMKSGDYRWFSDRGKVVVRDESGQPLRMVGTISDITQRKQAEQALQESEERYRRIVQTAEEGIWMMDAEARTSFVNPKLAQMLGYPVEAMRGRLIEEFMDEAGRKLAAENIRRRQQGLADHYDFKFRRQDGTDLWAWLSTNPIFSAHGAFVGTLAMVTDITARKQAEAVLQRTEQLFRSVIAGADAVPYDYDYVNRKYNFMGEGIEALTGYRPEEISPDLWNKIIEESLMLGQSQGMTKQETTRRILSGEIQQWRADTRIRTRSGQTRWLSDVSVQKLDATGRAVGSMGIIQDITDRKLAEQELTESRKQLRALLARLQEAQEAERIRVAREIHDELGQLLTGLKMDVRWMEKRLADPELPPKLHPLLDRAVAASELADQTIAVVQKIAAELRPGALDRLGLGAALTQRARRFHERTGIQCLVAVEESGPVMSAELVTELYYICQEALTNVARHAQASEVHIRLEIDAAVILLVVEDNGKGMAEADFSAPQSLGLLGMRERALHCGGTIVWERAEPHGTRVTVQVPRPGPATQQEPKT